MLANQDAGNAVAQSADEGGGGGQRRRRSDLEERRSQTELPGPETQSYSTCQVKPLVGSFDFYTKLHHGTGPGGSSLCTLGPGAGPGAGPRSGSSQTGRSAFGANMSFTATLQER